VTTLPTGTLLERYTITRMLGEGGFGITYLAEDKELGKKFAIKEYFPQSWSSRDESDSVSVRINSAATTDYGWGLSRFKEEARTLAKFRHPNIVNVNSILEANNTAYMVLDYEDGDDLGKWLQNLKRPPAQNELDAIVEPVLDALELIHSNKILHRDIAPDNIYIRKDGSPVLLDFGSARNAIGQRTRTVSAIIKMGYSPIEQYSTAGKDQGPWTDIYALGATLYRAVTGERPPEATERALKDEYVSAREEARGEYREGFLDAIDLALGHHFKDRPQTIDAWRSTLFGNGAAQSPFRDQQTRVAAPETRLAGSDLPEKPASTSSDSPLSGPSSSSPVKWVAGLVIVSALAAGGYYFSSGEPEHPAGFSNGGSIIASPGSGGSVIASKPPAHAPSDTPAKPAAAAKKPDEKKLDADSEKARIRGVAHFRAHRFKDAIGEFTTALRLDPKNYHAYANRGLAHARAGDEKHALKDYNRALAINPKDVATLDNRAALYVKQNRLAQAAEDYDDAILYRPKDAQLYNNRGYTHLLRGQNGRALADFDTAIRLNPRLHVAYASRAEIHEKQGRIKEAIEGHRKALEITPDYAASKQAMARLLPEKPRSGNLASANLKRARQYNAQGLARAGKGDHDRAVRDFTQAIQLDSKYAAAYNNRGISYKKSGDLDRAIHDYRRQFNSNQNTPRPITTVAMPSGKKVRWPARSKTMPEPSKSGRTIPQLIIIGAMPSKNWAG